MRRFKERFEMTELRKQQNKMNVSITGNWYLCDRYYCDSWICYDVVYCWPLSVPAIMRWHLVCVLL